MPSPRSTAFDALAATYDHTFTSSALGRLLRPRVWRHLRESFAPGAHVLELACGTGVDAVWLARQGIRVTATDGSPAMVQIAAERSRREGLDHAITVQRRSFQDLVDTPWPQPPLFDGAFSNFGGLNTLDSLAPLAQSLAAAIRPAGHLVLVPMGPICPWELLWHLAHRDPGTALRRLRQPAVANIGDADIPIWYPTLAKLKRDLAPWFGHRNTYSLGLFLPPGQLRHLADRFPRLFARLNHLESALAPLTRSWGDHYVATFYRTSIPANRSLTRNPSSASG